MVEVCCTARLVKRFDLSVGHPETGSNSNALGPWYATLLNVGASRLVVWLNQSSNLTVITRARGAEFPRQFPERLYALLNRIGIPDRLGAQERVASSTFQFLRAQDRSILGSLRDAGLRIRWDLERGLDFETIEDHMAEMPARATAFIVPREVTFLQLGLPTPPVKTPHLFGA